MDSNLSQPLVSTPVDTGIHKEDQQATGGPTSLGVTNETRTNPQLSSGMSAFKLNEPIYLASFIIHFGSASGNDASAASTVEADPKNSAPSDFVPQQQGMNEGTKNTSYDQLFAGTDPHVLADQTKSISEGLETILTQPITTKRANSVANLDSPEDDPDIIVNDSNEDKDDEVHATENGLKNQVHNLEIELPGDLKEISPKLEDFTKTAKLKTLDALPSLLNKVTNALKYLAQAITSKKTGGDNVPLAG
ncbi:hypothetical protein Tco_0836453 [Tanacetum coccineum]